MCPSTDSHKEEEEEEERRKCVFCLAMEACFLSSSTFTKSINIPPTSKPRLVLHSKGNSTLAHRCRSIKCCLKDSSDEDMSMEADWRAFRARLVVGERASRPDVASVNVDTVVDGPRSVSLGNKWAHKIYEPEKGCLLVATEKLDGVHIFERAVILLLSTGPLGPTGIILNRPSLMSIKESKSTALDVAGTFSERPLYFGGPLEEEIFLVSPQGGNDGVSRSGLLQEVMKDLYYGTKESVGCVAEMVKRNVVGVGDFSFFDGSCGWEKGQLNDEIQAGYWAVAACSPTVIGLGSVGKLALWHEIVGLMASRKVW